MNRNAMQMLERELREDAQRDVPAFSLSLHQRVMEGLRACGCTVEKPVRERGPTMRWRMMAPVGLAAAVAVVVWLVLPRAESSKQGGNGEIISRALPAAQDVAGPSAVEAEGAIDSVKYAYLDRDAERLFTFVADQLPELPGQEK